MTEREAWLALYGHPSGTVRRVSDAWLDLATWMVRHSSLTRAVPVLSTSGATPVHERGAEPKEH